ncbi:YtxH domain-containing protein [Leucobacter sp. HY1910]
MKGKVAFVFGAAVGYVLGTRAGRERYAQIKRGAQAVWETAPVQRGVGIVREAAQERVDAVKAAAARAGKGAFNAFMQDSGAAKPGAAATRATPAESAKPAEQAKPAETEAGGA